MLKRVFLYDILVCDHCSRLRRILAFITDPRLVRRILEHVGLPTQAPRITPARPPPGLYGEYGI